MNKPVFCGMLIVASNIANALPKYEYQNSGLQITCPAVDLTQISDDLKNEVEKLEPTSENCYMHTLNNVLSSLKNDDLSNEELISVAGSLCSIGTFLSKDLYTQLSNSAANLLCRACLECSIDAMWNLIGASFFIEKQYIKDVINIGGIDNLDYNRLMQELTQELEESESKDSFINAIRKMQQKPYVGATNQKNFDAQFLEKPMRRSNSATTIFHKTTDNKSSF